MLNRTRLQKVQLSAMPEEENDISALARSERDLPILHNPDFPKYIVCHQQRSLLYLDLGVGKTSIVPRSRDPFLKHLEYSRFPFNRTTMESLDLINDHRVRSRHEYLYSKNIFSSVLYYRRNFRIFLAKHILDTILNSQDKMAAMRRHLPVLRKIVLAGKRESVAAVNFAIFNSIIEVLEEHCVDSHLVVDVLTSLSSMHEFLLFLNGQKNTKLVEYVMYHCQTARFHLWGVWSNQLVQFPRGYPRLFKGKNEIPEVLRILLKYGVSTENATCLVFCDSDLGWFHEGLRRKDIETEEAKFRRQTLRNMLWCFTYLYRERGLKLEKAQECLRMIWECLPDAYHSASELEGYIIKLQEHFNWLPLDARYTSMKEMCNWYINDISKETEGKLLLRSLQQHCRVTIRNQLAKYFQLPGGIDNLRAPKLLQKYLRLELREHNIRGFLN